ncbi:MAG: CBS domain-containing protein [Candidatus Nanopelagicales bacterium]
MTTLGTPSTSGATVSTVRHSPAVSIGAGDNLWDAWQLMFVSGLRHLAVLDDSGACTGVLSDRAVLTEIPLTEERLSARVVSDIMAVPGCVSEETTTHDAAMLMARHSVEALPIVNAEGRLTGLITATDLVDWFARN